MSSVALKLKTASTTILLTGCVILFRHGVFQDGELIAATRANVLAIVVTGRADPDCALALHAFGVPYDAESIAGPWTDEDRELSATGVSPYDFSRHPRTYSTLSESLATQADLLNRYRMVSACVHAPHMGIH
jgi:hypothetical protein